MEIKIWNIETLSVIFSAAESPDSSFGPVFISNEIQGNNFQKISSQKLLTNEINKDISNRQLIFEKVL